MADAESTRTFEGAAAVRANAAAGQAPEALDVFWTEVYTAMINHIDQLVTPYLRPDFFFVNIGANDGVTGDPIYPFIRRYGWRGIAVEPAPPVFERLAANYADLPGVALENAAIAAEPSTFWYIEPHPGSPDHIVSGIGSLDRHTVLNSIRGLSLVSDILPPRAVVLPGEPQPVGAGHAEEMSIGPDLAAHLIEIEVPCLTVAELLDTHGASRVDVVNIDAEGHDGEILAMFDLDIEPPILICIETGDLDGEGAAAADDLMARHGYTARGSFGLLSSLYLRAPG